MDINWHLFAVKIVMFVWKDENKWKTGPRMVHIFLKKYLLSAELAPMRRSASGRRILGSILYLTLPTEDWEESFSPELQRRRLFGAVTANWSPLRQGQLSKSEDDLFLPIQSHPLSYLIEQCCIYFRVTPLSLTEKFHDQILCYKFTTKIREKWKVFARVSLTRCNGQYY